MDKKSLMEYQNIKREQEVLAHRIEVLKEKEVPTVAGKVKASSSEFPYTEHWVSVEMEEPVIADRIKRMILLYRNRQEKLVQQMLEIEEFIDGIRDAELRQIFELRFIEGRKLQEIADRFNMDRSGIGKKITAYLQLSPNSQKSMI